MEETPSFLDACVAELVSSHLEASAYVNLYIFQYLQEIMSHVKGMVRLEYRGGIGWRVSGSCLALLEEDGS